MLKANSHDAICGTSLKHTTNIASCEGKNPTNLSQLSHRNEVVTTCKSYKLLLQMAPYELASQFMDLFLMFDVVMHNNKTTVP